MRSLATLANLCGIATLVLCFSRVSPLCALPGVQASKTSEASASKSSRARELPDPDRLLGRALELRAKLTRRDLSDAARMFHRSAMLFHVSKNARGEASAAIAEGDVYQMLSTYPKAQMAYGRALRVSSAQPDQRCEANIRIARSYANAGQDTFAQQKLGDAVTACGTVQDPTALSDFEEAQGEAELLFGRMPTAAPHLEKAIELAQRSGYRDGEALATLMLAATEPPDSNGNVRSAVLAESALSMFLNTGNRYGAARAQTLLGLLISGSGDLERSKCHCMDALHFFERIGDFDHAAVALNALALSATLAGDPDEALKDYKLARRFFASAGDYLGEQGSIAAMSRVLPAEQYSRKPASTGSRNPDPHALSHSLAGAALINRAAADERANRFPEAREAYERSFAEYLLDGNKRGEGDVRMRQAVLETNHGKPDDAIEYLAEALKLKVETKEIGDQARIQYLVIK